MRTGITSVLNPHVGNRVSALVDGQLSPAEEERIWQHVMVCPPCRRRVEQEGWTKTRLRGVVQASETSDAVPQGLRGSLYDLELRTAIADQVRAELREEFRAEVARVERSARRRTAAGVVGVGSLSVAVLCVMAVTASPADRADNSSVPQPPSNSVTSSQTR